jgi:uncharacterized protein DUF4386
MEGAGQSTKNMSADVLTNPLGSPETAVRPIEPAQRRAAKIAGFLYLFTNVTAIFGYCLRGPLLVQGDPAQTARNIAASERLYRISLVSDLLTVACVLIMVLAFYIVLKPINRNVALLATFWRLAENFILAIITLSGFAALALVGGGEYLRAFDATQLQALIYTLAVSVHGAGFNIGFVFLGLGSTVFSYLWLKSRYIPRVLAAWGLFSSLVMAIVTMAIMVFPSLGALGLTYMMPMGLYEIGLGFWLLINGIKPPTS